MEPLGAEFFLKSTHLLARDLLGKVLVQGDVGGRVIEVEAYQGPSDRAAHSYGGRRTRRTEVMFGPPGTAYVYLIYGMYTCLNVVSAEAGSPEAILIRALEPIFGVEKMASRRLAKGPLASGPGRLTQALGITLSFNRHRLWCPPLYLADDGYVLEASRVAQGPRIGVAYAKEAAGFPWRYWIQSHPLVSKG